MMSVGDDGAPRKSFGKRLGACLDVEPPPPYKLAACIWVVCSMRWCPHQPIKGALLYTIWLDICWHAAQFIKAQERVFLGGPGLLLQTHLFEPFSDTFRPQMGHFRDTSGVRTDHKGHQ